MTARQRGPSGHPPPRPSKGPNTYSGRQGSANDRDLFFADRDDRGYSSMSSRGGPRDPLLEGSDTSPLNPPPPHNYRSRTDSNSSLPNEGGRIPRSQVPNNQEESRGRGASMGSSPNRMYRDDGRPRSNQSNTAQSRDKLHYEYQPPQFPQNPFASARQSVTADFSPSAGQRGNSRPVSRTQSPIPPFPSTPPSQHQHRFDAFTPEQPRGTPRSNMTRPLQTQSVQVDTEKRVTPTDSPYALPPLKFSPHQAQSEYKLLAGTQFDDIGISPDNEHIKVSPPAPSRPPPPPPIRQKNQAQPNASQRPVFVQSPNEVEPSPRMVSPQNTCSEDWPLEQVLEFLRMHGFGEPWLEAFRKNNIHGEKFLALSSYAEAKKLIHLPPEYHFPHHGRNLPKLISLIRKVLPEADMPDDSESYATPTPKARRLSDSERTPIRRDTAPAATPSRPLSSNINLPSPDSDIASLPNSAKLPPRHNSEQQPPIPSAVNPNIPTPKLQPPPPPRAHSPQDLKRPLSPSVVDGRQPSIPLPQPSHPTPPQQFLGQYNRHSKNFSTDSNLSNESLKSAQQAARSSQDFQEILQKAGKEGCIVPQKKVDKKKSHEQISKPGLLARFFQRDKSKEIIADVDEEFDSGAMSPPLPPQPPYNSKPGMNNSQSSLDSSPLSTPIDDPRSSMTTSVSSLPSSFRPPSEPAVTTPVLPSVLWVQITQNGEDFRRCDLSHVDPDPLIIRDKLCHKFNLKAIDTALFLTDIDGTPNDALELDDEALLRACARGDGRGSLKFLLRPHPKRQSPGKLTIPPPTIPQASRLAVPDGNQDGRDARSTSISEDSDRKGHYRLTPKELYRPDSTGDHDDKPTDYFDSRDDPDPGESRRVSHVPTRKDEVDTTVFHAAREAKKKREGSRKRTESGASEKSPHPEEPHYPNIDSPLYSPTRRRSSVQDESGFEKLGGWKLGSSTSRPQPSRQQSLPLSPASPSFRILSKENQEVMDFSRPLGSPYATQQPPFESLYIKPPPSQLPTRTPSGIKAHRKAPAPPQGATGPTRAPSSTVPRNTDKPLPRVQPGRRPSEGQNGPGKRFLEAPRRSESPSSERKPSSGKTRHYTPSVVADLVSKSSLTGGTVNVSTPNIVAPAKGLKLEPMTVIPKRAPSPNTPGARLGLSVDTNLKTMDDDSPPTEWRSSVSGYPMDASPEPKPVPKEVETPQAKESLKMDNSEADTRFRESANISFDDAPAFDLPDDDDEGSLWAVKPVGVEDSPSNSHKSSVDTGLPLLRKKSSLRQKGSNKPPLTVQIDERITEIPTPLFSAIAEESTITSSIMSSIPSESTNSSVSESHPRQRSESPEFTVGDDSKGLNSPMHPPPRSPSTPSSATSATTGATDLTRKNSFAKHEDVWAVRPPPELVLDNLEEFFPDHDLDKPILVDQCSGSPPISPADASDSDTNGTIKPPTPLRRQPQQPISAVPPAFQKPTVRMKSIRVVAKEAVEKRKRLATVAKSVMTANLLRRKSTKVWGARMLEMTPGQVRLGQIVTTDVDDKLERRRTFKWVKGELIGKGTYGSVYLGLNATTGEMLAVKQVEITRSFNDDGRSKSMVDALNAEIETLKDLDHENIVQYLGYERTDATLSIFLEYIPGGSVGRCLKKHGRFEEQVVRSLIRQTLNGLAYLHERGRLHRDLKADNLLLDLDGICKISDFGISKQSKDVYANDHYTLAGTIFWMAPEVVRTRKEGYSAKIDIWSLGCVVLEMFAGKRPWSTEEFMSAMFKLGNELAPPIPDDVKEYMSADAKDFLEKCFTIEAAGRPTAAMLLNHPFCKLDPDFNFSQTKLGKAVRFGQK